MVNGISDIIRAETLAESITPEPGIFHGIPLLSVPKLSHRLTDPLHWAEAINTSLKLNACEPQPLRESFFSQIAHCSLGSVDLLACAGTPIQLEAKEHDLSMLTIKYGGTTTWESAGYRLETRAQPSRMLYLPASPFRLVNTISSCAIIFVRFAVLLETACSMLGSEPLQELTARLQGPRLVGDSSIQASSSLAIKRALMMVESLLRLDWRSPALLRCDDLINRMILHLLIPDLLADESRPATCAPAKDYVINDLVAWIRFNLHRPICLSDLERYSQLSRRTLQYTWRQRFGLSPMQWLKKQRMEAACRELHDKHPTESITAIAAHCGYHNLAAFSRDFRNHYGVPPSHYAGVK